MSFSRGKSTSGRTGFAATPTGSLRATGERTLLSRVFASWNQLEGWLRQVEVLRTAA